MFLIFFFIYLIVLIFFLNNIFIKYNFLLDKKVLPHKSFLSNDKIPLSGGFLIAATIIFFYSKDYLIFFLLIFILGIFSDLLVIHNPLKKIIIQFVIIFLFIIFTDLRISSTKIVFIDLLIKNNFFSLIFVTFCLLILINGSNFLDGLNTLVVGYYMLVILAIFYLGINYKINYNYYLFICLFLSLFVIFVFNFLSKIYLGDAGVFLLSFIIGYELIQISNFNLEPNTQYISPIFIVLLLWYPAFENLFSIIRKSFARINPTEPDNRHLHHLLFLFIKSKIINNQHTNSLSANLITFYNLIIFLLGINYFFNTKILSYILIINILIYSICYYLLLKTKNVSK